MGSLKDEREPSHPPALVAGSDSSGCPRVVLLPRFGKRTDDDDFSGVADAKTTSAASRTSTGRRFRVSFGLAPSPEISSSPASPTAGTGRVHRSPTAATSSVPLSSLLSETASCYR